MKKNLLITICVLSLFVLGLLVNNYSVKQTNNISVVNYSDFISALKSKGFTITELELTEQDKSASLFSATHKLIKIKDDIISIYEFDSIDAALVGSKTIYNNGSQIGNNFITWLIPPYIYNKGKLIVVYGGNSSKLARYLKSVLGKSIVNSL